MPRFQDKKYIRFGWPGSGMCGAVGCLLWWEVSAVLWDVWDVCCGGIAVGCAAPWYVWCGGMCRDVVCAVQLDGWDVGCSGK